MADLESPRLHCLQAKQMLPKSVGDRERHPDKYQVMREDQMKISEYINSDSFKVPRSSFIYKPIRPCSFAHQGEQMVELLIELGPTLHNLFNGILTPDQQASLANDCFKTCKRDWLYQQSEEIEGVTKSFRTEVENILLLEDKLEKPTKKYFETNRRFSHLSPSYWKRTSAPRLITTGSTFHGMKKNLKYQILKEISKETNYSFIDFDMSAAHARIALSLLGNKSHYLREVVNSSRFWDERTEYYLPKVNKVLVDLLDLPALVPQELRAMLKVSLYTSLNGGNPFGPGRLLKNIHDNALKLLSRFDCLEDISAFERSELYKELYIVFSKDELIAEVKDLNKSCYSKERKVSYTIDREAPYQIDKSHKGISRVLQGFEVVF